MKQIKYIAVAIMLLSFIGISGQNKETNVAISARVVDKHTIKLRWAPENPKAWADGNKYGYTLERYTLLKDSIFQQQPEYVMLKRSMKPAALSQWEKPAEESDYAAVIAQAIYGEDFEVGSTSSDIGQIINQSNELQQRFATSIFMAGYDFNAAGLAGWAYIDQTAKEKDQYLYRLILERPQREPGDTAIVFLGYKDRQELPKPMELNAIWGDQGAMLYWNYELLSSVYHSYHIERKTEADNSFKRISQLPVTAMSENKQFIFYTDSLPDNETVFSYRVIGITTFGEESIPSDTVTGSGIKTLSCSPNLYTGEFTAKDSAHIYWNFNCENPEEVEKFVLSRSTAIDGEYDIVKDNISTDSRETTVEIKYDINYLKMTAVGKNGTEASSFPLSLNQVDSVPPAVPKGLKVTVDSAAVAHLTWDANQEPDLRGYRILRAFTPNGEKSSITPDFIAENFYTDTLSLEMGNEKVYYSLTALDIRYNESPACETVEAVKPNNISPATPRFTGYEVQAEGKVYLSWATDVSRKDIDYFLTRTSSLAQTDTVFSGNEKTQNFTDEVEESGDYEYAVIAKSKTNRKETVSPQKISVSVHVLKPAKAVSGFHAYADTKAGYIELSWKKHPEATSYSLYKKAGNKPIVFWKEVDSSIDGVTDETVTPDTNYEYTIVFTLRSGGTSKAKTIKITY